ncbi:MAG: hypothetical protein Q4F72_06125 [Desulfovibrionaceae bacterium]|nr:hypothetical protein [Desulfovibrionaceae bacterium]
MSFPYEDIVGLPHLEPHRHKRMPMTTRAAQFAPFAALAGHEEAVRETARVTEERRDPSEEELEVLNERHRRLTEHLLASPEDRPVIRLTWFEPDRVKEGGAYVTRTLAVEKVDENARVIRLEDGVTVPMDEVFAMEGEFFTDLF